VVAELTRLDAALADRLDAEGRGQDRLRVPDAQTEAQHAVNRRVEVELGGRR
jgi:flagellar motor protein MotB